MSETRAALESQTKPSEPPTPAPEPPSPKIDFAALSQWQLIRLRFAKHKGAVAALNLIFILYLGALFAEFFAPYGANWKDTDHIYAPPQIPSFSFQHGWHVKAVELYQHPVNLSKNYLQHPDVILPLSFFVKGQPYKLWGLIPMERRFFGPDKEAYYEINDAENLPKPVFNFLGADRYGRDILSRLIYGARISLSIGLTAIFVTFLLGIIIGGISGYCGGKIDLLIQRVIEIINSFPHLPLWLAIGAVLPSDWSPLRTYFAITIVLSLLTWTPLARVVRGKILSLREEDYAVAARLLGASHQRVLFRHLVPAFTSHIIVVLTLSVPTMILGETALSFLGLGLRPPVVSWGVMMQDCLNLQVLNNYPWLLMPVLMTVITVLSFNFLGDGMRDAADPYSSK